MIAFELQMLAASVVLGFVHIAFASFAATAQRGVAWNVSSREQNVAPLTGAAGRLSRALSNFMETFPLFAAMALAVVLAEKGSQLSEWGAGLYLAARVVYLPLYGFGVPVVRSLVWIAAALGIVLLVVALLA